MSPPRAGSFRFGAALTLYRPVVRRLVLVVLAACSGSSDEPPKTTPLWSDGTHLRDAEGRVALLRGVNARVEGVFDVTFDDGRTPLETIPPLTASDCARMRQLGFDLLRLPINWSGIEPTRGVYSESYLAKVDAAVECAHNAGVLVLVDLHQDAYSKEIGEDGAPLWAIDPPPTQLLQGPLDDLGARRVSPQVQDAFRRFFTPDDPSGLQAAFADMLTHVGTRYAKHPGVVGFEIFNEPDTGTVELDAFYARTGDALRSAAPEKLVFFEPPALRNFTDFIPTPKQPFPTTGAVYSPHIYTFVFQPDQTRFQNATAADLEPSVAAAREEATAFKTPLFIGEFGVSPDDTPQNNLWMRTQGQLHDRYFASNAFWVWKEQSQGSWGVYAYNAGTWMERPNVVAWVSRIRLARIAGTPRSLESSALGDSTRLELESATEGQHLVYIPERYAAATRISCDGATIGATRDVATGLAAVSCKGTLEVVDSSAARSSW